MQRKLIAVLALACALLSWWPAASAEPVRASVAPPNLPVPRFDPTKPRVEVVGGLPSSDRKIVGISYTDDQGVHRVCSGLWISRRFVITAAHCTCNNSSGHYNVTNTDAMQGDWRPARLHRRYDDSICATGEAREGNDLALLVLGSLLLPAAEGRFVCETYSLLNDIRLAGTWMLAPPARIQVSGYGFVGDEPGSVGQRRAASVVVNSLSCGQPLAQRLGCWPLKEMILGANRTDGEIRDTCGGDSGGPAFVIQNGDFMPIGIVSRGLPIPHVYPKLGQCGAGGIYTHLGGTNVIAWLQESGVSQGTQQLCQ